MKDNSKAEILVKQVTAHPKYQHITNDLVFHLSREALDKGLSGKTAIKYVRNKLHQVGGAYFKKQVDYIGAAQILRNLPQDTHSGSVKDFCRKTMQAHASTAERLPILEAFFHTCLAPIAPVTSVLDLACGLNPLAIPWMPLTDDAQYIACDIYLDMLEMINEFFSHINLDAIAKPCDLVNTLPDETTQLTFLLKSIPCLEQLDKTITIRLMDQIPSEHILISFPARNLAGRKKGMENFYRHHFLELLSIRTWEVREFVFESELAFLVSK
jgi:16S rRNA (guanine(1405)-N(7))-methyltransferase